MSENRIEFSTSNNSSKSYLVATIYNKDIIDYQLEMINSLEGGSLLNIEKRQLNLEVNLFYDITNLVTLEEFFKNNKLNKSQFIEILKKLSSSILSAEENYLISNNYILDIDKIFIEQTTFNIKFAYVPFEENYIDDINGEFKNLIKYIIVDYANIEEQLNDNYIQKILNYLKESNVKIKDFYNFVKGGISTSKVQAVNNTKENINEVRQPVQANNYVAPQNTVTNNNTENKSKLLQKQTKAEIIKEEKEVYKTANLIIATVAQIIVVVGIIGIFIEASAGAFGMTETAGGILLLGVVDFLVIRNVLDKKKKIKVKVVKKATQESVKKSNKNKVDKNTKNNTSVPNDPPSINLSKREISTEMTFETELLTTNYPFLLSDKGGSLERIYISKDTFVLGRMATEVDYVILNKAVGKVHAKIVKVNNNYIIIDLNSKNGTFINGQRLNTNSEYQIQENDMISFANESYVFKVN